MNRQRVIVWFRQDLRLHDNEALTDALKCAEEVVPVYVFDERLYQSNTRFGFKKMAHHRARFVLESVQDLKKSLQALGSNLVIRVGKPEDEICKLARQIKSSLVFCNRERTRDEVNVQDTLERNLWSIGQEMIYSRGKMLYYTQDLPFPVTHYPDTFTTFRKEVERMVPIREALPSPTDKFNPLEAVVDYGDIPTLQDLGYDDFEKDPRSVLPFEGGETKGLARLHHFLWETDHVKDYKKTRNNLIGESYSSKFSPWLAQGCLSPKQIYKELKKYEEERGSNESTYWLFFELLWRDFFRLMGKKHGNKIFLKGGILDRANSGFTEEQQLTKLWTEGRTGMPFIDANMRELKQTGFMSNRGRQNVASFLVNDLKINWQIGASYFESMLLDYDPCSNWGNWAYLAGVGNDPREDRYFNILKQAQKYDPKGDYVKLWIPELKDIPCNKIHDLDLSEAEQLAGNLRLGDTYPKAMISLTRWE